MLILVDNYDDRASDSQCCDCINKNGNENHVLFFEIICLFLGLPEISEATAAYQGTPLQADRHSRSPPTETNKHE